ncbi:MAG: B12-binding domain-containing radical SAM protein [Pseudanabaenaceae cyanobacterium]
MEVFAQEKLLFTPAQPNQDAVGVVYAFPNTYSVGITSLGYQWLWAQLAQREDVRVSRYFVDVQENVPAEVELVGFSFSWELDYGNILHMLEEMEIPLSARERRAEHPLVFGGGAVLTANPEPFAEWFDVILLGDGEELLENLISAYKEVRGEQRSHQLRHLAQVAGIYVPSLYEVEYGEGIKKIEVMGAGVPPVVEKQTYRGKVLSSSTVVTPLAAWENIYMVEVVRSCPEMCRFCLASYVTLPFRSHAVMEGLIPAIDRGLQVTNRLGLLGASITQHPQFSELLAWLDQPKYDHVRLSLASVRTNTLTVELAKIMAKHDSRSVTVAIETGSPRLREVINKKLTNEEIMQAVVNAQGGGLQGIKFYGMVGVPTEEMTDIDQTIALFKELKKVAPKLKLAFGCSTFVPKAHTPWQWMPVDPSSEKKLQYLQKKLGGLGIEFRPEGYKDSLLQAVISRGDRRLSKVLLLAYEYAQGEGKTEPSLGMVKRAFKELQKEVPPFDWYVFRRYGEEEILPWQHLRTAIKPETLLHHFHQSLNLESDKAGRMTA